MNGQPSAIFMAVESTRRNLHEPQPSAHAHASRRRARAAVGRAPA